MFVSWLLFYMVFAGSFSVVYGDRMMAWAYHRLAEYKGIQLGILIILFISASLLFNIASTNWLAGFFGILFGLYCPAFWE